MLISFMAENELKKEEKTEEKENKKQETGFDFYSLLAKNKQNKISTPDELNDYLKVIKPSTFLVLIALIIFSLGIFVWSYFGRIDTTVDATIFSFGTGKCDIYVLASDGVNVKEGMYIRYNNRIYIIDKAYEQKYLIDDKFIKEEYREQINEKVTNLRRGDYVYSFTSTGLDMAASNLPVGLYTAEIILESVAPISYLFD